jgi:hypothetical protein
MNVNRIDAHLFLPAVFHRGAQPMCEHGPNARARGTLVARFGVCSMADKSFFERASMQRRNRFDSRMTGFIRRKFILRVRSSHRSETFQRHP